MASGLPIVTARHEQGAGYAALAIARMKQRAQVVAVTSGPGVTNIVTPVADAYYDSTPLVVLCGQVGTGDLKDSPAKRQRGFQEVDTTALLKPITKKCFRVMKTEELTQVMKEAFDIANSGRPGPVAIDLPMDVQRNTVSFEERKAVSASTSSTSIDADEGSIRYRQ
jgi:acetolactate synthase-1/2/3 large subunit